MNDEHFYRVKEYEKFTWNGHNIVAFRAIIGETTGMIGYTDEATIIEFIARFGMTPVEFILLNGIGYSRV